MQSLTRVTALTAAAFVAVLFSPGVVRAERIPVELTYGWGTEIEPLVVASPDSQVAKDFPNKTTRVAYMWDQLWFGFPFWITGHKYVIEVSDEDADAAKYFELKEQDREKVAELAGVMPDALSPPFFSRFPFGYVVVIFGFVVVKLMTGPSPGKRFNRLMRDERYRNAMEMMQERQIALMEAAGDADPRTDITDEQVASIYAEIIESLVQQKIGRSTANRNLQFILGFLENNAQSR